MGDTAISSGRSVAAAGWRADALCKDMPHEWFFPERGRPVGGGGHPVRRICAACPVTVECLNDALNDPNTEYLGFRGGTSGRDRRRLRTGTRMPV